MPPNVPFRRPRTAAPLKRRGGRFVSWQLRPFRRPRTAAPLKRLGPGSLTARTTALFPSSSDGGPIEANLADVYPVRRPLVFPSSSDGGPIEARVMIASTSPTACFPSSSDGGPIEAACWAVDRAARCSPFRRPRTAAPLKPGAPVLYGAVGAALSVVLGRRPH